MFRLIRYVLFFFAFTYVWYVVKRVAAAFQTKRAAPRAPAQTAKSSEALFPPTEIKDAEFKEIQ